MPISRRDFTASLALPALAQGGSIDASLVRRHDEAVDRVLKLQITDKAHPEFGGYADETGLFHPGTGAGILDAAMAAYLCPQSRYHKSPLMIERGVAAAGNLRKHQHEDGTVDLLVTNFHSTPDLGFVVHGAAAAGWLARKAQAQPVIAALDPFLLKAGDALARGGVHTPNHRWVVCQALSQLNELHPNPAYTRRVEQWLAEGIDIDADGQYNERSTTVYNPVTDIALTMIAIKLNKPELLDPVRRNLESMLYLLHADGEVVTEISNRQDQYLRGRMDRYWLPLRYLALKDGDGRLAELARRIEPTGASLSAYLRLPELAAALPASKPLPEDFHKLMPVLEVARIRRGALSASILLKNNSRFFTMRNGACVVEAVRFASAFFGKGQFRSAKWEKTGDGYRMTQSMEGPYYQPLDPPRKVEARDYASVRLERKQTEVQQMTYTVDVRERGRGFAIDIRAEGTAGVPLSIEIALRDGVKLEGVEAAPGVENAHLLKSGYAVARAGSHAVRFGPGLGDHRYTQVRGAEAKLNAQCVYLCGFTPLKKTIEFEAL